MQIGILKLLGSRTGNLLVCATRTKSQEIAQKLRSDYLEQKLHYFVIGDFSKKGYLVVRRPY